MASIAELSTRMGSLRPPPDPLSLQFHLQYLLTPCRCAIFPMMESTKEDGVYSIGAVVKMLGVPAQTLRSWEERYHQVVPARSAGGQRIYSRDQVDQLRFIVEELDRGMAPSDAHRLLEVRSRFPTEPRAGADGQITILLAE